MDNLLNENQGRNKNGHNGGVILPLFVKGFVPNARMPCPQSEVNSIALCCMPKRASAEEKIAQKDDNSFLTFEILQLSTIE